MAMWRSWLTLAAFGYSAAANAVMFMDFVVLSDLSSRTFGVDVGDIAMTYSLALFTTLPTAFLVAYFLPRQSYYVFGAGALFNTIGAWLRWLSAVQGNWAMCLASTVSIGVAFAVCCMSYAVMGERWFPPELQMLATSIGVQSNYAGWCLSAFLIPTVVQSRQDLEQFLLYQAFAVTAAILLFMLLHDESAGKALPEEIPSVRRNLRSLSKHPKFFMKMACYATLGAVSYTIPAVQDVLISETLDATPAFTKWTDAAFIAIGVVAGMLFSVREPRNPDRLILCTFAAASVGLVAASLIVSPLLAGTSLALRRAALVAAMAVVGGASLGFLGVALTHICHEVPSVHEAISAGAVEWFVQAGGGILSSFAVNRHGFEICGALVVTATGILLIEFILARRSPGAQLPDDCSEVSGETNEEDSQSSAEL
ncbi:unnamed protein product [Symbiodinium microadriaticum]|nr:unnamed protein product [Symbiodinium microadriaticum]